MSNHEPVLPRELVNGGQSRSCCDPLFPCGVQAPPGAGARQVPSSSAGTLHGWQHPRGCPTKCTAGRGSCLHAERSPSWHAPAARTPDAGPQAVSAAAAANFSAAAAAAVAVAKPVAAAAAAAHGSASALDSPGHGADFTRCVAPEHPRTRAHLIVGSAFKCSWHGLPGVLDYFNSGWSSYAVSAPHPFVVVVVVVVVECKLKLSYDGALTLCPPLFPQFASGTWTRPC